MTNRSPRTGQSKSSAFTISLIVGLLLIPLSGAAAAALISSDDEPSSASTDVAAVAVAAPEPTVTTTEPAIEETVFVTEAPTATVADIEAACGPDGLELVEREAEGSITDLEQAALDALRQICADQGLDLAGPPAPPAVVRTVTVVESTSSTTAAPPGDDQSTTVGSADDAYEGEDGDDEDHEEEDHEDEDHGDEDDGHEDDD